MALARGTFPAVTLKEICEFHGPKLALYMLGSLCKSACSDVEELDKAVRGLSKKNDSFLFSHTSFLTELSFPLVSYTLGATVLTAGVFACAPAYLC